MTGFVGLSLQEVQDDVDRVIKSVARIYRDDSCFALNFDDLVAEGYLKFAKLLNLGWLDRYPNRREFFALLKTAVKNHVISIVQKSRFTTKRMGSCLGTGTRPEVSMDEVTWLSETGISSDRSPEWLEALRVLLNPVESIVLDQLVEPGPAAKIHATFDACRGGRQSTNLAPRVTTRHLARGIGLPENLFKSAHENIRRKAQAMEENTEFNRSLTRLEEHFGVQVPPSIETVVVRRLFTLCARNQHAGIDDEIRHDLRIIGARVPEVDSSGKLNCFGVLWERGHRICTNCGAKQICQQACATVGLGKVAISPEILGMDAERQAHLNLDDDEPTAVAVKPVRRGRTKTDANATAAFIASRLHPRTAVEESIISYLHEHFKCAVYHREVYWKPKEKTDRTRLIFWGGPVAGRGPFNIRCCSVSEGMKASLERHDRSWYLPDGVSEKQAQALIDQHAHETIHREEWVAVRTQHRFREQETDGAAASTGDEQPA